MNCEKHNDSKKTILTCLLAIALFAGMTTDAQAFLGFGKKGDDKIGAAVKRASELSREAEIVWEVDANSSRAIELYQQAIDVCLETEAEQPKGNLGSLRFQRAFCETQIDRIKFDVATSSQRNVAIMRPGATTNRTLAAVVLPASPTAGSNKETATFTVVKQPDSVQEVESGVGVSGQAEPPVAVVATAQAASAEGEKPQAGQTAASGAQRQLDNAEINEEVAWARDMLEHGDTREARQALMKALRADPDHRVARFLLAAVECHEKRFEDALIILEDLSAEQESSDLYLLLAGAYLGAGQPYRSMLELDKLLKKEPSHADALVNMAYLTLELSGKISEAEMYYLMALKCGARPDENLAKRLGL